MKRFILGLLLLLSIVSCKENDNVLAYDTNDNYVYFAVPNPAYKPVEKYIDSVYYSFATDEDVSVTMKRIAIPVNIGGEMKDTDRPYSYTIAAESDYDPAIVSFSEPKIGAGKFVDTLYIDVQRDEELATKQMTMILEMQPNENFVVGHAQNKKIRIVVDDILMEPEWWNTWRALFGDYHKEVFQQWIGIYYLGADPSPDLYTGEPGPVYYWNNMPDATIVSWYPVTHQYIQVLKKYFLDHEVYPGGDTTKDRILLP